METQYFMQQLQRYQILVGKVPPGSLLLTNVSLETVNFLIFSKPLLALFYTVGHSLSENKQEKQKYGRT
jgi:hypothetical protein